MLQELINAVNNLRAVIGVVREGERKTATIAAGDTVSDAVDIGNRFAYLLIKIPTITSAQLELQVSDGDGTYQDFGQNALTLLGTGAYSDTWVLGGWRYIKIKSSVAQVSAVIFRVRGVTY